MHQPDMLNSQLCDSFAPWRGMTGTSLGSVVDHTTTLLNLLDEVLSIESRGLRLTKDSPLLDAVPGFDSMAVVALIERIENEFDIAFLDTEIDGSVFSSVSTLQTFVEKHLPD
ncbi:acyl carrier protein [Roseateles paludis]|uniref:Acyl carrier protein n=1 Tax=Roseateles paludis TaxID=3145238 RepID=A0ABV0G000_9BURK